MRFLPGVAKAIAILNHAGFRVIIVSTQRCVAKGLVTADNLDSMHRRMCECLARHGAIIDAVLYCPHEEEPPCSCRKPAPGMLLAAALAHQIDLAASWMIGDSEIDLEAGRNAGCRTAQVLANDETATLDCDVVGSSLLETVDRLLRRGGNAK